MNAEATRSSSNFDTNQPHCQHRTASGRRCRRQIAANSTNFCLHHLPQPAPHPAQLIDLDPNAHDTADFASTLSADAEDFQTAKGIHASLTGLYLLLSQVICPPAPRLHPCLHQQSPTPSSSHGL